MQTPRPTMRAANFSALAGARRILLAVSGGPDSMALMLLAARWARRDAAAPELCVATVDHGLRPGSADEAAQVGVWASARGLSHTILRWEGDKPTRAIQEKARAARYALLVAHARAIGAQALATAHHAEDQAETVLFRLLRGSGVAGLAGMTALSIRNGLPLHRPLLDWSKAELAAVCAAEGQPFLDDPSNRDPAFARARLRASAATLAAGGLDRDALVRLARRAARAEQALTRATDAAEARLRPDGLGLDALALIELPDEIALRLVERLARGASGGEKPARLDRLESVVGRLRDAARAGRGLNASLAGAVLSLDKAGKLTARRESPRRRGRKESVSSR